MSKFTELYVKAISTVAAEKRDEEGATATEYALLTAGIAVGLLGAIQLFSGELQDWFEGLGTLIGI